MWETYATGVGTLVAVLLVWVGVQGAWRRTFPEFGGDPDVLAARGACNGCGCAEVCARRRRSAEELA
jgi:hypothetical protein